MWLVLALLAPAWSWAHDKPPTFDRVNLSVSASEEVASDVLVAVLYYEREGSNASQLADAVNKAVTWALEQARKHPGIKAQTLDYYSSPVYRKQTLSGWRVRQSVRLESQDKALISELIGTLQERLNVASISYELSPGLRQQVEERLIKQAVAAFQARAELISGQFGRPGYRIVELSVNTSGDGGRPPVVRTMAMEAKASVSAPAIEPGVQKVRVGVTGSVEMKVD